MVLDGSYPRSGSEWDYVDESRENPTELSGAGVWTIMKCRCLDPLVSDEYSWSQLNKHLRSSDSALSMSIRSALRKHGAVSGNAGIVS
jgi:hypothetical protein